MSSRIGIVCLRVRLIAFFCTCIACIVGCGAPELPPDPPGLDPRTPPGTERCGPSDRLFDLVGGPEYVGAIVPEWYFANLRGRANRSGALGIEVDRAFTPSVADVEAAESGIRRFLGAGTQNSEPLDSSSRDHWGRAAVDREVASRILRDLPKHHRQYAGLVVDGRRQVLCRFFMPDGFFDRRWQCEIVGRGVDFFERRWVIRYDMETKTYEGFDTGT